LRGRPLYGSINQTDLGNRIRAEFMMDSLTTMGKWLLMYGPTVEIEEPDEMKNIMSDIVEELHERYSRKEELVR